MQIQVQQNPRKGFWLVSTAAFLVAPFLTNDGVCLLFVELILDAFEATKSLQNGNTVVDVLSPEERAKMVRQEVMPLETGDAIYFLLTLACSSNIGSGLTYTGTHSSHIQQLPLNPSKIILTYSKCFLVSPGNPQNMIVAQDASGVLPPLKFLGVMLVPCVLAWLLSKYASIYRQLNLRCG